MDPLSDAKVIDSWHTNATPWTSAIREERIESRKLVTNQAVIDAVMSRRPQSVLDIGCGEGWLSRALAERGVAQVVGVDVVPALIDQANAAGGGEFRVASYEAIAAGALDLTVDVAVANFALIGKDAVDALVRTAPTLLDPGGALIIQTLHPVMAMGDQPYKDGWRAGSWAGFSSDFSDPAPWYFRTLETWIELIASSGLRIVEMREPLHPTSNKPASVIFVAVNQGH
ncbi:MAG TPA: class I SAM-dependent methyltransferase [Gemmatimonadaceae bacterium]|nr:class I SAM-dependent methyltransferase [Gemmatimonadaceae bacterium]